MYDLSKCTPSTVNITRPSIVIYSQFSSLIITSLFSEAILNITYKLHLQIIKPYDTALKSFVTPLCPNTTYIPKYAINISLASPMSQQKLTYPVKLI